MDTELLAKCRTGDPQAIETLVYEHQARVYRLCLSILEDAADAQDAAQESFIAALKSLNSYRGDSAFNTWLYAITLNTCRSTLRKRKRRQTLDASLAEFTVTDNRVKHNPERAMLETERSEALWQAINKLDEKHRLPIILRYYHELSTEEISEVLAVNVGTIHSRLSNARSRLSGDLKRMRSKAPGGKRPK